MMANNNSITERSAARISLGVQNVTNMVTNTRTAADKNDRPADFGQLTSYLASRGYSKVERDILLGEPGGRNWRRISIDLARGIRGDGRVPPGID